MVCTYNISFVSHEGPTPFPDPVIMYAQGLKFVYTVKLVRQIKGNLL